MSDKEKETTFPTIIEGGGLVNAFANGYEEPGSDETKAAVDARVKEWKEEHPNDVVE